MHKDAVRLAQQMAPYIVQLAELNRRFRHQVWG